MESPGAIGLDLVEPIEEVIGSHGGVLRGSDDDDMYELSVFGHVHPNKRNQFLWPRATWEPDKQDPTR